VRKRREREKKERKCSHTNGERKERKSKSLQTMFLNIMLAFWKVKSQPKGIYQKGEEEGGQI